MCFLVHPLYLQFYTCLFKSSICIFSLFYLSHFVHFLHIILCFLFTACMVFFISSLFIIYKQLLTESFHFSFTSFLPQPFPEGSASFRTGLPAYAFILNKHTKKGIPAVFPARMPFRSDAVFPAEYPVDFIDQFFIFQSFIFHLTVVHIL